MDDGDSPDWHTAIVDENKTQLAYIDSGAPASEIYTTLVCVHGHSYHAQIFRRLFPLAEEHNLRIVALNRRDYDGSTLFSEEELGVLNGTNSEEHNAFLKARGTEIARFLTWLIKAENIPPISEDGKSGGVVLMGWSAGNYTTLAFLGHLDSYPDDILDVLKTHIRAQIIYEIAFNGIGSPTPNGSYHPLLDNGIPEHGRGLAFGIWMSSYFSHPFYASKSPNPARTMSNLQVRTPTRPVKPATLETEDGEDLFECIDVEPAQRSEQAFYTTISADTLKGQIAKALAAADLEKFLPNLKVSIVYGTATVWTIIWGVWELEKVLKNWSDEGKQTRQTEIIRVDGANHFLHWDDAEKFLDVIQNAIKT